MTNIAGEIVTRVFFGENLAALRFGEETMAEALNRCMHINVIFDPAFLLFGDRVVTNGWFPHLNKKK